MSKIHPRLILIDWSVVDPSSSSRETKHVPERPERARRASSKHPSDRSFVQSINQVSPQTMSACACILRPSAFDVDTNDTHDDALLGRHEGTLFLFFHPRWMTDDSRVCEAFMVLLVVLFPLFITVYPYIYIRRRPRIEVLQRRRSERIFATEGKETFADVCDLGGGILRIMNRRWITPTLQ